MHDYNHGHAPEKPQVFDYKHQNVPSQPPADTDNQEANVIDYNHGKNDEAPHSNDFQYNNNWNYANQPAANWNDNAYFQQQAQHWNQNWSQENNFEKENREKHENYNNFNTDRNVHQSSGFKRNNSHNKTFSDHSGNNTPGIFFKKYNLKKLSFF